MGRVLHSPREVKFRCCSLNNNRCGEMYSRSLCSLAQTQTRRTWYLFEGILCWIEFPYRPRKGSLYGKTMANELSDVLNLFACCIVCFALMVYDCLKLWITVWEWLPIFFWTFLELSNKSLNLGPWNLYLRPRYFNEIEKSLNRFKTYHSYISQNVGNPFVWQFSKRQAPKNPAGPSVEILKILDSR